MFVSKYGKTYDTADGSEQSVEERNAIRPGAQRGAEIAGERWADDGGAASAEPPATVPSQPAWSVLPRHELDAAIRRELTPDDPARLRLEGERAARRLAEARLRAADAADESNRAFNDRYRNAWENT